VAEREGRGGKRGVDNLTKLIRTILH